jgi:hypothetical protein
MIRYLIISVVSGVLFGILDGVINGNPVAQRLYAVYRPMARAAINIKAGIAIDLAYGFIMAGVFLLLYQSLPGAGGLGKGASFGLLVWFFRVVMSAASQWVMFKVTAGAVAYSLATGLGEMLILGALYGLTLKPMP